MFSLVDVFAGGCLLHGLGVGCSSPYDTWRNFVVETIWSCDKQDELKTVTLFLLSRYK